MRIHLVRHASAGARNGNDPDDLTRRLDDRGRAQAEALCAVIDAEAVAQIASSHARRCVETVEPLARRAGVAVETVDELTEGSSTGGFLDLIQRRADADHDPRDGTPSGDLVLCSHGDLIPEVVNRLARRGISIGHPRGCEKGSVWTLHVDAHDGITRADYTPVG